MGDARVIDPADPAMPTARAARRLDLALAFEAAILVILTVVTLWPGVRVVSDNGSLDVALNTLAALAATGAAALAWIRYRIDRDVSAVYECAAFIVLSMTRAMIVGIAAINQSDDLGMTLDRPQQWPLYAWSLARLASAVLLILAAGATLRGGRRPRLPAGVAALLPALILLVAFVGIRLLEPILPAIIGPAGLAALRGEAATRPGMEPVGLLIQAGIGLVYLRGAQLYRQIYRTGGHGYAGWIAIALVVAAVSQVHWAFFPGIYRPVVTVDDALRAVFSVVLLLGIEAQSRADLGALRTANARLRALRGADAERAALEARTRFAREVHDGLSQELWVAKLKHARLAAVPDLPDAARGVVAEVGDALERALADARAVVDTMGRGAAPRSARESILEAVADFEARTGIRARMTEDGRAPVLAPATTAELLRIIGEALNNVLRHADATMVRVSTAETDGGTFEVVVVDNGRGFDASKLGRSGYGLRGMQERAALIGGNVEVTSRRADGTSVLIRVPTATGRSE